MNILIVCQHFWPESFRINEICADFTDEGHQVDVLCGIPNYPKGKFYAGYNYFKPRRETYKKSHIYRVGEIPQTKKFGAFSIILNFFYFPLAALFTLPVLARRKYDIIFLYSLTPVFMSFPGILLSKIKKIPTLMYILDYWPDSLFSVINIKSKFFRRVFTRISRWHYLNVTRLLTPSKGMQKRLIADYDISLDKTAFLPQSCETIYEKKVYSEKLHDRFGDRFNFVFAGNIGPAQALESLVDAVSILSAQEETPSCRFIIIGDGMSKNALQLYIKVKNLNEYFTFEGYQPTENVIEFHELADVLFVSLAPSQLFSIMIPAKIQSYMAAGKPLLGMLSGEGAQIIEESGCGKVSPPKEPEILASIIKALVVTPADVLNKMGEAGFNYYTAHYHSDIIKKRICRELDLCIKSYVDNEQK